MTNNREITELEINSDLLRQILMNFVGRKKLQLESTGTKKGTTSLFVRVSEKPQKQFQADVWETIRSLKLINNSKIL